jgi:hypothetical protein
LATSAIWNAFWTRRFMVGVHKSRAPASRATKVCTAVPNICEPSVWNFLYVIIPVPRILRLPLIFWKICVPLLSYLCVQSLMRIIFKPDSWQEARYCPFLAVSRPALGPILPPSEWAARLSSLWVKRRRRKAQQSPLPSTEFKNEWRYTPTSLYTFMTCTGITVHLGCGPMTDFVYTVMYKHNIICSMHWDYNHPYTPTNAHNLYKIINNPHTSSLLHVSAINCHPQGDIIQNIIHRQLYYRPMDEGDGS